jgi:hypothetical protein
VDVLPNGQVRLVGAEPAESLKLAPIIFDTAAGTALALAAGFSPYGKGYAAPTFRKTGDLVIVSGLANGPNQPASGQLIGILPEGHRPTEDLTFATNHNAGTMALKVSPDGTIRYVAGSAGHPWYSLSGIIFRAADQPVPARPLAEHYWSPASSAGTLG